MAAICEFSQHCFPQPDQTGDLPSERSTHETCYCDCCARTVICFFAASTAFGTSAQSCQRICCIAFNPAHARLTKQGCPVTELTRASTQTHPGWRWWSTDWTYPCCQLAPQALPAKLACVSLGHGLPNEIFIPHSSAYTITSTRGNIQVERAQEWARAHESSQYGIILYNNNSQRRTQFFNELRFILKHPQVSPMLLPCTHHKHSLSNPSSHRYLRGSSIGNRIWLSLRECTERDVRSTTFRVLFWSTVWKQ